MGRILLAKFFEVGKLNFGSIFIAKAHHIFAISLWNDKEMASCRHTERAQLGEAVEANSKKL